MIQIGLTGWGDHPALYSSSSKTTEKLVDYSSYFPVVELDSTFYAVQPKRNIQKWINETPKDFKFIVKAYQGITGHHRGELPFASTDEMYEEFIKSILPLKEANKLAMVLVQFPPWFDCAKEHVETIRFIHSKLQVFDVAIEFRHQSWYSERYKEGTLQFLKQLNAIHSVCDEPQAGEGSIPLVPISTRSDKVLVRLHGRNIHGWKNITRDNELWRKVRYLYNYNEQELKQIEQVVRLLNNTTKEVFVIFNNNSGQHAATNALTLQRDMKITYERLTSKQLGLFEEGEW